ncbi:hypothetical protein MGYG_07056 [Nannizzia gypsea CBS 118893]|uniref:Ubiquitin 3 binding protein But2 C-terminal domain-containing protein n=1 Tax=Arthroderma gypseum (strain ATCC MYA-4604 / CBS 118893) TaxID=535722 RepID=E4V1Y5_ARTGP|nr:hypothetical protein MGYG_07056 [Nannizzia gypsea CBS 118893]EFR04050.1 hypothetical protein MGYG_07056 [Nannizzia gypsea CBS 118893]
MKFTALLVSAAAVVLAAPTPNSNNAEIEARNIRIVSPKDTFLHYINTGETNHDVYSKPLVVKNGKAAEETSAVVTFSFDGSLANRRCRLRFDTSPGDISKGSQQLDVFSVINPPTWPIQKPFSRDQQRGRIYVQVPGPAQWVQSYNGYPEFDCPVNKLIGYEFVGVYDYDIIDWAVGSTGPSIEVL